MSATATVSAFIAAWEARDTDAVMALFTDDAVYHNMPMPPMKGQDEIRGFIGSFLDNAKSVRFEVLNSAEHGDVVLNERVDTIGLDGGKTLRIEVMGVFEVAGGKIKAWRDYFDLKGFEQQMAG